MNILFLVIEADEKIKGINKETRISLNEIKGKHDKIEFKVSQDIKNTLIEEIKDIDFILPIPNGTKVNSKFRNLIEPYLQDNKVNVGLWVKETKVEGQQVVEIVNKEIYFTSVPGELSLQDKENKRIKNLSLFGALIPKKEFLNSDRYSNDGDFSFYLSCIDSKLEVSGIPKVLFN